MMADVALPEEAARSNDPGGSDSPFPVVDVHDENTAQQFHMLDAIASDFCHHFPAGLRCSVHESMSARALPTRCGTWFAGLPKEPFPASFTNGQTAQGEPVWWRFPVRRDSDGRWRPMGGNICGFYLTGERVEQLVAQRRVVVGRDRITSQLVLADSSGRGAIIPPEEWSGECTKCGLCCFTPRQGTSWWCDALTPVEDPNAARTPVP